jgi:hypothetical protein
MDATARGAPAAPSCGGVTPDAVGAWDVEGCVANQRSVTGIATPATAIGAPPEENAPQTQRFAECRVAKGPNTYVYGAWRAVVVDNKGYCVA